MSRIVRPSQRRGLYGLFTLSADQVANLAATDHIEYDTVVGDLPLSTGAGQADGQILLPGGHHYQFMAGLRVFSTTSGTFSYNFYDTTAAAFIITPLLGVAQTTNRAVGTSPGTVEITDFFPTVDSLVELQIVGNNAISKVLANGAYWEIQEIL